MLAVLEFLKSVFSGNFSQAPSFRLFNHPMLCRLGRRISSRFHRISVVALRILSMIPRILASFRRISVVLSRILSMVLRILSIRPRIAIAIRRILTVVRCRIEPILTES